MPYSVSLTTRNILNPDPQLCNLWATELVNRERRGSSLALPRLLGKTMSAHSNSPLPELEGAYVCGGKPRPNVLVRNVAAREEYRLASRVCPWANVYVPSGQALDFSLMQADHAYANFSP